jgi:hypothetical protein
MVQKSKTKTTPYKNNSNDSNHSDDSDDSNHADDSKIIDDTTQYRHKMGKYLKKLSELGYNFNKERHVIEYIK